MLCILYEEIFQNDRHVLNVCIFVFFRLMSVIDVFQVVETTNQTVHWFVHV